MTNKDLLDIGFKPIPHYTIMDSHIYLLSRNRYLSIGGVGSPNEMMFLCESDNKDYRIVNDAIAIHNFDFDGYITKYKITKIIELI